MKRLAIILFLYSPIVFGQYNYLKNNGFEELNNPNIDFSATKFGLFDPHEGRMGEIKDWNTRTVYYSGCTLCYGGGAKEILEHSPDVYGDRIGTSIKQFKGQLCIGAGSASNEIFQQNLKKKLFPGNYIFSGYTKQKHSYTFPNIEYISLSLSDNLLEFECENDCQALGNYESCFYDYENGFLGAKLPDVTYDFGYSDVLKNRFNQKSWHNFNFNFNLTKKDLDHACFDYQGHVLNYRPTNCFELYNEPQTYSYFDEFSIQRASCFCIDDWWLENRHIVSNETIQVKENLRLGYNVENVTDNGDVIIDGNNIKVKAGKSVRLEPGTIIKSGSNAIVKIEPCSFKNSDPNKPPKLLFMNDVFSPNATDPRDQNITIGVENATDYFLQVFSRWGDLVLERSGQIADNNITMIEPFNPNDYPNENYVYQLWICNCNDDCYFDYGSILFIKSAVDEKNINNSFIYPNPTSTNVNISFPLEYSKVDIIISDLNGKNINLNLLNESIIGNLKVFSYDVSNLSVGTYNVSIYENKVLKKFGKFIKNEK